VLVPGRTRPFFDRHTHPSGRGLTATFPWKRRE
jgi:hypothetical protein